MAPILKTDHPWLRTVGGGSLSRLLGLFLCLAAVIAAGVAAAEQAFYRYLLGEVTWSPAGLVAHFLLDSLILLPLVLLVVTAALLLGRRLGLRPTDPSGLVGVVGLACLLFALATLPTVVPRDNLHNAFGTRFNLPLAETKAPTATESRLERTTALCSYSALQPARSFFAAEGDDENQATAALVTSLRRTFIAQGAFLPLLLVGLLFLFRRRLWPAASKSKPPLWRRRQGRWLVRTLKWSAAAGLAVAAIFLYTGTPAQSFSDFTNLSAAVEFNACTQGGPVRTYDVSAIEVVMTLNRFGDHNPTAFMYVLDQNIQAVRNQEAAGTVSGGLRKDPIQPLVLRANLGECVVINFTNDLIDEPAAIHILGLPHTANNAGGEVGLNPNTFAAANGGTITYQIPIPTDPGAERAYYFYDHGASRQRVAHGLFGALVVEPAGSTYLDPETGNALNGSNWEAIIVDPAGDNFREFVIFYHEVGDESFTNIQSGGGGKLPQLDNASAIYRPGARALNYRSEPFLNRMDLKEDKSLGYSSYTFGDPATPIPRSYLGEPTKTRLLHGGSEQFHVHHLHGGAIRWRRNPDSDPANDISSGLNKEPVQNVFSTHLDSQSVGPGTSYNLEHECGAGGCQQAAGDFLYHCHIGQHYIAGMWSLWRVHDTLQADLATIPQQAAAAQPVSAYELLFANSGRTYDGNELVLTVSNPSTQMLLSDFIEAQLPPQGVPLDLEDATVWDWQASLESGDPNRPVYLGEPDDTAVWANFDSPIPGQRPEILFNLENGRYTWPMFRPHLGQRPPFSPDGHTGTPWLGSQGSATRPDGLCPSDSQLLNPAPDRRQRSYPITGINVAIQVTDSSTDPNGKIFVLNEDKADVLAGTKPRQPLAIRSNVQDCTEVILTNELPDSSDSLNFSKTNIHSHFVQFDPQASDGVITGFSYEQSVRPYATENRTLVNAVTAGATTIDVTNTNRLRSGIWIGVGLGEGVCDDGGLEPVACTEVRRITAITGNTLTLDQPLDFDHGSQEAVGVEFVRYNWYADVDTGTVFWHDHVNFMNWDHGLFGAHIVEPPGSTYHDPVTGAEVRSGTLVDVHAPAGASVAAGQQGAFREVMVFLHNASPANGGNNFGGTINLRAEPFASRNGDPAHRFSSVRWDDPITPKPRAYVGDPVIFRGLGVVERVGGLRVSGHRFRVERFAATAPLADTTHIGISERFDVSLDGGAGGPNGYAGDYLYYSTIDRDFAAGAWGILRVHDTLQGDLQLLPGLSPPSGSGFPTLSFTGNAPPEATDPGNPCPGPAPVRSYDVRIGPSTIIYQDNPLIRDTSAVVYTLDTGSTPAEVREPLVLRVNDGECLEVNVFNATASRASYHASELLFDPQGSYGSAVGFDLDSTIAPGASRLYRYYADQDLGISMVINLADTDSLRRGAFAAVVVEPPGSTYHDPATGAPINEGVIAEINAPGGAFREMVALITDEDADIGQNIMPYPTAIAGSSGLSYSVEDLDDRDIRRNPTLVFSSTANQDPRHVLEAPAGTPVIFRVGQPAGEQVHVFSIEGHRFPLDDGMAGSEQVSSRLLLPGMSYDADLVGGAGAGFDFEGDYLFFDNRDPFTEKGLWGILRVGANTTPVCGNGVIETGEECDAPDLGGAGCSDIGCSAGTVACTASCTLDFSACTDCAVCGNGIREGTEECDGADLGGATCSDFGCSSGGLSCFADCTLDSSQCTDCGCVPSASKEKGPRCSDGIDNDCDGLIDGADPDC